MSANQKRTTIDVANTDFSSMDGLSVANYVGQTFQAQEGYTQGLTIRLGWRPIWVNLLVTETREQTGRVYPTKVLYESSPFETPTSQFPMLQPYTFALDDLLLEAGKTYAFILDAYANEDRNHIDDNAQFGIASTSVGDAYAQGQMIEWNLGPFPSGTRAEHFAMGFVPSSGDDLSFALTTTGAPGAPVYGTATHDRMISGQKPANMLGFAGDDLMVGSPRSDTLKGGEGADVLYGRSGGDALFGDDGADRLIGGIGQDKLNGGAGDDVLLGGSLGDYLSGNEGNDTLGGGDGRDALWGRVGDDRLLGREGADKLFGGPHNDRLLGGAGNDTLNGGKGSDRFVFDDNEGVDRVIDFQDGVDRMKFLHADGFQELTITKSGPNSKIVAGFTTVIVDDMAIADLGPSDFIF